LLRVGRGFGNYCYGRPCTVPADELFKDIGRASGIALLLAGPAAQVSGYLRVAAGTRATPGSVAAESGVGVASGMGGEVLPMKIVKTLPPGTARGILNEAKALTFETGNEHALVRLATGERALVSGGPGGISFAEGHVTRIIGHTHPYGAMSSGPSAADAAALRALGQTHSYVVEGGRIIRFGPASAP
jgi:hypothetical protein